MNAVLSRFVLISLEARENAANLSGAVCVMAVSQEMRVVMLCRPLACSRDGTLIP
jgi:hypothetical protein